MPNVLLISQVKVQSQKLNLRMPLCAWHSVSNSVVIFWQSNKPQKNVNVQKNELFLSKVNYTMTEKATL